MNKHTATIKKQSTKDLFSKLWSYSKGFRKKIFLITVLNTFNALITIAMAMVTKNIIDAATSQDIKTVKLLAGLVVGVLLFKLILTKGLSVYKRTTKERMHNELQKQVIESYYRSQWLYIDSFKTGDLITRATNDVSQINSILLSTFPSFVSLLVQLITAFSILSSYDYWIAFVAFILGPMTLLMSWTIGHKLKKLQYEVQTSVSDLRSSITESVQNIELVKTYNIEHNRLNDLDHFQKNKRRLVYKKSVYKAVATGFIDLGYTLGYLGAILIGAYKLYNRDISFGTFTAFSQLVTHIQNPMYGISKTIPSVVSVLSSVERISVFETHKNLSQSTTYQDSLEGIEFDCVSFAYENRDKVVDQLNFKIYKGQKIGLKGPSGEGKTTILRLLLSLIEPTEGSIMLHYADGQCKPLTQDSKNIFSYVPQRNALFSGTLIDNLKLGNAQATDEEIKKALRSAQVYDVIQALPQGLESQVGERLRGLSEGQAQRICIARALLHNTPVLILDEATSALDVACEKAIVENIKKHYAHKTLIAVTHRSQIFDICDDVYEYKGYKLYKK